MNNAAVQAKFFSGRRSFAAFPNAPRVVNPRILRAARLARLGPNVLRAVAAAGGLALAPEAALAAAGAAIAGGAYYAAKRARSNKQKRLLLPPAPSSPAPVPVSAFPVKTTPIKNRPVLVPSKPSEPMAPTRPSKSTGASNGGGQRIRIPRFSPVSTITKAPVAIGNTIRGAQTIDRITKLGQACTGRDFMFTPIAPGAVANWTIVGGCPLSPTAFADSTLRQYAQIYNKFRFLQFTAHFITSSPTSTNGDVMFYYGKNREGVFLNQTSSNLLPFVMSDPNAVLGPQWQNMSATFNVDSEWKSLDYGMEDDPKEYASGELFLLCKTSNTESPGYVIFDYVIEFGEKSIQPRLLSLPITRQIYSQLAVGVPTGATVINTPYGLRVSGNPNISGTTSVYPTGIQDGDIYKVIIDLTNSTLGAGSSSVTTSVLGHEVTGSTIPLTMSDGFTCYAVYNLTNNQLYLYSSAAAAWAGSPNRIFWASNTGAITLTLQIWMSYVGSIASALNNVSNF